MTPSQREEFEAITRPVIEWLNENCHPHMVVIIHPTSAALYEGEFSYPALDYLKD